jgi:hypothetical protein
MDLSFSYLLLVYGEWRLFLRWFKADLYVF